MEAAVALTTALHRNRARKPEAQVAEECGIAPAQLHKYRSGHERIHVDEWVRVIRCLHEVDPVGAAMLAGAALPAELFCARPMAARGASLTLEVLDDGAAHGRLAARLAQALTDGRVDGQELDELDALVDAVAHDVAQTKAAIAREREENRSA